nr:uncharacterized protein LOC111503328 isoform X2 [Leptinotarsa decemlineata]
MNLTEELQEKLDILKAIPSSETNKIKSVFFETFKYRRSLINKGSAMEIFPKFHETVGLIEQEFLLMFPSYIASFKENYLDAIEKILEIFENTSSSRNQLKECGFNRTIQSFFALLKMLPPSPKGKRKKDIAPTTKAFEKVLIFHQISLPLMETIEKTSNTQPYIIAKGNSKLLLEEFLIVLDGKLLPDVFTTFEDSVDYLMKVHFVFQVKYDSSLENLYKFIQVYFYNMDTENVLFNSAMLKLKCLLKDNDHQLLISQFQTK